MSASRLHRALALGALTSAAATLAAGCATLSCTEVGCSDSLTFTFDEQVPLDYVVTVEIGGKTGQADCTAAAVGEGQDAATVTSSGDLAISLGCSRTALVFGSTPTEVAITITFPDGVTTEANARPAYQELQPNGEDCPPTCLTATVDINVHPPQGS